MKLSPHRPDPKLSTQLAINNGDQPILHPEGAVARVLKVQTKTLQAWRHRGGGPPFVKVGRLVRYRLSDVESWLASRTVSSTSEGTR